MNKINVLDLDGIVICDYYYPNYLGSSGCVFKYSDSLNQNFLFFLAGYDFEIILEILCSLSITNMSQILEDFLNGGFSFTNNLMNEWWLISDKGNFIDNLYLFNKTNLEISQIEIEKNRRLYFLENKAIFKEIIDNLILFLESSNSAEVYIHNI